MVKPLNGSTKSDHDIRGTKGDEKTTTEEESVTNQTEEKPVKKKKIPPLWLKLEVRRRDVDEENTNVGHSQKQKQLDVKHEEDTKNQMRNRRRW